MLADYHIHTSFSDDSDYQMEKVVKEAISKNFNEICFTDHVDYGVKFDRDGLSPEKVKELEDNFKINVDYPKYFKTIEELKNKYKDQINIKTGLEFGIQVHTIPLYEKLFDLYPYDFIINSCHQVDDLEFWNYEYQENKTRDEFHEGYYKEILDVANNYNNYSVLGHLDHHVRYDEKGTLKTNRVDELIDEILRTVIRNDRGIEVNTSYFRYKLPDLTPSKNILKRYKELGGKILTIGSDSHKPGNVGERFPETIEILKNLGFSELCTFTNMKPNFYKI